MILNQLVAVILALSPCVQITIGVNQCPDIRAHWWESRPYVYDEQGTLSGVLPNIFAEAAKYCCTSKLNIDWSSQIDSYERVWLELEQNVNAETNRSVIDIWLPFSSLTPTSRNTTALKIVESNQIILFVSENKWDKLESVYNGFKRIAPQILGTLLLTILFGILIWIVVRISLFAFFL